jgi:hypothetical protein
MFSKSSSKTNIRHFRKTPITNTKKNTGNAGSKIILVVVEELDMVTWRKNGYLVRRRCKCGVHLLKDFRQFFYEELM